MLRLSEYRQKGIALYYAVLVLAVLLSIALGLSTIAVGQLKVFGDVGDSVKALYAADSGMENVLYEIKQNNLLPDYSGTVGDVSFTATLKCGKDYLNCPMPPLVKDPACDGAYYCVKSVGTYKNIQRAMEASM